MKYASAAALDRAITDILLRQVGGDARRYQQLRREVAFERVLARLVAEDPEMWLLINTASDSLTTPRVRVIIQ